MALGLARRAAFAFANNARLAAVSSSSRPSFRYFAEEAASAAVAEPKKSGGGMGKWLVISATGAMAGYAYSLGMLDGTLFGVPATEQAMEPKTKDYSAVRKAIAESLDVENYDDGSYGPVLVRLAWHTAGTYDKVSGTGGSSGCTIRFSPECNYGANAGLEAARKVLEPIKAKFPWITYADLYTLAGVVAIEEMGGPNVPWSPGRVDKPDGSHCPPDGRLPDAALGAAHIRSVFYRMGFNDQEIVALSGAHCLGQCHRDRSGFKGPWTNAPTTFSNLYFQELLNNKWTKKKWDGPLQYEDSSKQLMMLPTDMALLWDKGFKKYVELYAKDSDKLFTDFAAAFSKLLELGAFPATEGGK